MIPVSAFRRNDLKVQVERRRDLVGEEPADIAPCGSGCDDLVSSGEVVPKRVGHGVVSLVHFVMNQVRRHVDLEDHIDLFSSWITDGGAVPPSCRPASEHPDERLPAGFAGEAVFYEEAVAIGLGAIAWTPITAAAVSR
ncbi:hypothetical protein [Amycolatopsis solani]|uniref:hypothetical protein n=1 Tax=Amycolatopsis solani TaxID=3028615 RepID=UPI0025B070B2|nr:hypothetical protein [Amycolatopsis sp. MEP2-6]